MTLMEVVIALGIISVAVIPMMGVLAVGYGGYRSAMERNVEASILNYTRTYTADLSAPGQTVADSYFTVDGVSVAASSPSSLSRVTHEPAERTTVSGGGTETLTIRFKIIHIPSGQTNSSGVIHITPR